MLTIGRVAFAGTLAFALLGVAVLAVSRTPAASADELRAIRDEVARLKVARPKDRLVIRNVDVAAQPAVSAASTQVARPDPAGSDHGDDERLSPEERDHRLNVFNQARADACRTAHSGERPDPEWSPQAQGAIQRAYASDELRALNMAIDCRATLCRADFTYSDANAGMVAIGRIGAVRPWIGRRFWQADTEKKTGTIYFARENFDLPPVDPEALKY